jgi:FkbM family methyltransferase
MSLRTKIIQLLINTNEKLVFQPKLRRFFTSRLKKENISIIDVGANKGQTIEFFIQINPKAKLFSFEPNKKLAQKVKDKFKNNPAIEVFNLGISSQKGLLTFHENVMDETSTFEQLNFDSEYLKKKARILGVKEKGLIVDSYEVEVTTLSDFIDSRPGEFFDVLKIDVEGHELHALKGLFSHSGKKYPIRFIQMESHNDDMYVNNNQQNEIKNLLASNGFEEAEKFKHGFGDFHEIIFENKQL